MQKGRSCCSSQATWSCTLRLMKRPSVMCKLRESHRCCTLVPASVMPTVSSRFDSLLLIPTPLPRNSEQRKFLHIFGHKQNMCRPLNPVTCCSDTQSHSGFVLLLTGVLPVSWLQDSDSPRHSTASNSSNLSSPPSPVSPHKTKSLSLESSDHVSWDS